MSMDQLMALVPIEAANSVVDKGRKSRWEKTKERKGGSRWGLPEDKPYLPPHYVDLPSGLTPAQMDQFLREQRFDELSRKLAMAVIEMDDADIRPPSPPPIYDKNGSRTNTRDVRAKNAMNAEYQRLVEYMIKQVDGFAPPSDYKPAKKIRRIEIPLDKYPDYNFMGLIIGPRGCNHKRLESESGAQISIRGKGTQKEGKKTDHQTDEEASLPMHVHIASDSEEAVEKAVSLIEPLLDPCHPMHEEFKKRGLEQLSLVNGIPMGQLDQQRCAICSALGHLAHECPDAQQAQNFKKPEVRCAICGDMGHVTMDCKLAKANPNLYAQRIASSLPATHPNPYEMMKIDSEYKRMMNELTGETPKTSAPENIIPPPNSTSVPIGLPSPFGTSHGMAGTPPPGISPGVASPGYIPYPYAIGFQPMTPPGIDPRQPWVDPNKNQGPRMKNIMTNNRLGIGHPERPQNARPDANNVRHAAPQRAPPNTQEQIYPNPMMVSQPNGTINTQPTIQMPNQYPVPMPGQYPQQMPVHYPGQLPGMFMPIPGQAPNAIPGQFPNLMNPQISGMQPWPINMQPTALNPNFPPQYFMPQLQTVMGGAGDQQTTNNSDPPLPTDAPPHLPTDSLPFNAQIPPMGFPQGIPGMDNKTYTSFLAFNHSAMMNPPQSHMNSTANNTHSSSTYDINNPNSPNDDMDMSI